jgi:hypothetical protein
MSKKGLAISQSILLILGIVAMSFMIGSEFKVVSANTDPKVGSLASCSNSMGTKIGGECYNSDYVVNSETEYDCLDSSGCSSGELCCWVSSDQSKIKLGDACKTKGEKYLSSSGTMYCDGTKYISEADWKKISKTEEQIVLTDPGKAVIPPQGTTGGPVENVVANKEDSKVEGMVSDGVKSLVGVKLTDLTKDQFNDLKKKLESEKEKLNELLGLGDKADAKELADTKANVEALGEKLTELKGTDEEKLLSLSGSSSFLGKFAQGFFKQLPMKAAYKDEALSVATKKIGAYGPEKLQEEIVKKLGKNAVEKYGEEGAKNKLIGKETNELLGKTTSTMGYALYAAAWASMGATVANYAAKAIGASERNQRMISSGTWVAAGTTAVAATLIASLPTSAATALFTTGSAAAGTLAAAGPPGWMVAGATIALTAIWGAFNYQDYSQEALTYQVGLWQPEKGGELCQSCNDQPYGCSEYQCRSYGAGCTLLNAGTEYESCDWNNSRDFNPPQITQLDNLDIGYTYNPMTEIQLPDRGVSIVYEGPGASPEGCIPAFTGVKFGVKTDEPAQCKIDLERKYSFGEMLSFMNEGTVYTYNHTLAIPSTAFPSQYALTEAGWTIDTGKEQNFFVRCEDSNGNLNPMHFVINFCVDDGPDTTPPEIETNYLESAYIKSGTLFVDDVDVYTNEPADCRWDFVDRDYDQLEYEMTGCSKALGEYTFPESYKYGCHANLTGINDGEDNDYFIRCKDKPNLDEETAKERRVANEQSYKLTLIGTKALAINAIAVNDETLYQENAEDEDFKIVDSTSPVTAALTVKTTQGAEENGNARCSYKSAGSNLFFEFYNNGIFDYLPINTHELYLGAGNYNYDIRCCDLANNCDTEQISFEVETDTTAPEVSRAYFEDKMLKLVTTESAECVYTTATCNYLFDDGLAIETKDNLGHYLNWDTTTDLHIKCKDKFGNLPDPKSCQITVRAYEEYSESDEE